VLEARASSRLAGKPTGRRSPCAAHATIRDGPVGLFVPPCHSYDRSAGRTAGKTELCPAKIVNEVPCSMKLLPLAISAVLVASVACGSSSTSNSAPAATTARATPFIAGLTPVATTRVGTPRPGSTPRATPALAAVPTVPPGTGAVQTTPSGLQYQEISAGTGAQPQAGQTVVVNYTGWLDDGTKFDSSLDRNQPFSFTLGKSQVIKGWDEGVATMKVGGKRRLIIPASLGYGAQVNGKIPANARLTFDIELLDVK
jgi:peptidylprolyl isomerase